MKNITFALCGISEYFMMNRTHTVKIQPQTRSQAFSIHPKLGGIEKIKKQLKKVCSMGENKIFKI
jgi:hypothetical protein